MDFSGAVGTGFLGACKSVLPTVASPAMGLAANAVADFWC